MAINKQFDDAIDLQLDLFRAAGRTEAEVLGILRALERELAGRLAGERLTEWGRARAARQIRETRELIADYYRQAQELALESTQTAATVTAAATATSIAAGGESVTRLSDDFLRTLAGNSVIQGAVQSDWWARQSADTAFRYAQALRQGIAAQDANGVIIQRVREFMQVSRANAAALVQTSTATVANDARMALFERNADIIKRYRAVATLDTRTCMQCAPLDGLEWEPDGTPIGHSAAMPRYPLHFNCRCQLIPRVFDGEPEGQRAARGGPVDADLTFEGWIDRQPPERLEEFLGPGRAELYRSGKITLAQLTSGTGRPLTLDQLRARYGA